MTKAQVGDLVRILPETWAVTRGYVHAGEIVEVVRVASDSSGVDVRTEKDAYTPVEEHEYVIHRKAGEEDDWKAVDCDMCNGDPERADCPYCATEGKSQDAVNSPNHYTQGRFETIEIIEEITKGYEDGYVAYCVGNALKYLARAPFKHGEPTEDLAKASKYLAFANEYLDAKSTETTE